MSTKSKPEKPEMLSEAGRIVLEARYKQLDFLKHRQWTITNYVALIYGALFGVKHLVHSSVSHQDSVLKFFAVLASAIGALCPDRSMSPRSVTGRN